MTFAPDKVISMQDASIYQGGSAVLSDVNFELGKGEFVFLIGRNGSGKSSLLKTLYADLTLHKGSAEVAGFQIKNIKRSQVPMLRRKLGIIFQDFQLFPDRTVADNLSFVMQATGWRDSSKMKQRMTEVLIRVGLGSVMGKMPHQLSGGEQQRVVIARSLINDPLVLLADEPTGNLDPDVSAGIYKTFQEINRGGTAVIMATHDYSFLKDANVRVLKCSDGRFIDSEKEEVVLGNSW